jgi:LPS sulfotransferase NodH
MTTTITRSVGGGGVHSAAPRPPATAYLICTLPRSGSTLLSQGLRFTGIAGQPEEYFWSALRGEYSRRWGLPANATDPVFLARVRQQATTPNGVFGAKVHWAQLITLEAMLDGTGPPPPGSGSHRPWEPVPLPSHGPIEAYLPGVRYVHLTRRDKMAQAISLYRALASGVWLRRDGDPEPTPDATLDPLAVERLERRLRENEWRWIDYFGRSRVQPLTIAYEDLSADYAGTIRRVLEFLDLPEARSVEVEQSSLQRQSDGLSKEWCREVVARRARRVARAHRGLPSVSVVVVTHNEGENLRRTIDGFTATVPDSVELLVVDDSSTDDSVDRVAEDGRVRVVSPPRRAGVAGARNFGARHITGDLVIFSDAHVDPLPGWLPPLCQALTDPSVAAAAPAISRIEHRAEKGYGFTWRDASLAVRWLRQRPGGPSDVPFLCGCFMAFRRADFEEVGGFDDGMVTWGSEDAEICLNLWRRGRRSVVVPESDVAHLFRPAFPYAVHLRETLHNLLRLATVHLDDRALATVLDRAGKLPAFAQAYADLLDSDAWQRRELVRAGSRHDGDWFLDRFRIALQA